MFFGFLGVSCVYKLSKLNLWYREKVKNVCVNEVVPKNPLKFL